MTALSRPTIRDVAAAAGVSSGTVSRVLNGKNWVSPEARSAVEAAIRKTGYRVNPHARSLAMSRANTVAFLLTENQQVLFEDPNFSALVRGTSQSLADADMSLVLIMAGNEAERARAMNYISAGHVDGVLLAFTSSGGAPLMRQIVDSGTPVVACGMPMGFEGQLGSVSANDEVGAMQLVQFLRASGRRRIATIAGPLDTPGGVARLAGWRRALGPDADESLVALGDYNRASGAEAMRYLLSRSEQLDAVFAANDAMAAGAIDALQALGKRVPEDVAVAGFDDNVFALSTDPPITTMHQPFDRISAEMVRVLLAMIEGEGPATVTLPARLVERAST